jgi:hypothetical protein
VTKRCPMTICFAVLAISTALAQENNSLPAQAKQADNGPSLVDTMSFVQQKIAQQGRINYAVYGHDSANNSDGVKQLGFELQDVMASPARCQLSDRVLETENNQVYGIKSVVFDLNAIADVAVLNFEQAIDQADADAGHPARSSKVTPPRWIVLARRQKVQDGSPHEDVKRYTKEGNGMNVVVTRSEFGDNYHFRLDFIAPSPEKYNQHFPSYDLINVYGSKTTVAGRLFSPDGTLPSVRGHWKPGDSVQLQFDLAKQFSDPAQGWYLNICIGTQTGGCIPSVNLLEDSEPDSYEFYFHDEDVANRVAKALVHAVELCGGGSQPEPF